jgi:hypothetical protein
MISTRQQKRKKLMKALAEIVGIGWGGAGLELELEELGLDDEEVAPEDEDDCLAER